MSRVVHLLEAMAEKRVYWDFLHGEGRLEKTRFAMLVSFRAFATSLMSVCQDLER